MPENLENSAVATGLEKVSFHSNPKESENEAAQSCPTLWDPMKPTSLLRPWDFPGKSTGVGCHFLLQGIFPTQGLNLGLLHCTQMLYRLSHQGSPIPKKGNANECSNYRTIALISHASKVMLKILQARLQQYVNCELPDVQAGFRKGRGTRDQIANICWIIKKQKSSRETSISALLTMPKPLTVDHNQL